METTLVSIPSSFLIVITLTICILLFSSKALAFNNGGFSVELIRTNSPKSPFHNLPTNPLIHRRSLLAETSLAPVNGQHHMKLSVGTPPTDIYALFDTGSDLFWFQCLPCANCYKQIKPVFNPKYSKSYSEIACGTKQCGLIDTGTCSPEKACVYGYGYGSGSTNGVMASESMTLTSSTGQKVTLPNIVFGCGHNNSGSFSENEMGLIGMGRRPLSFISQVGPSVGGRKFSHCLVAFHTPNIASKVTFGSGSEVVGPDVLTIPLVSTAEQTLYHVTVEGITVGDTFVAFSSSGKVPKGNIIFDTGTPPSILPLDIYKRVVEEIKRQLLPLKPTDGPEFCYKPSPGTKFEAPVLKLKFEGGASLELKTTQNFIQPNDDGIYCFTMQGDKDMVEGMIGNFAMVNYLIGYDLDKMTISFKPTDCTKH